MATVGRGAEQYTVRFPDGLRDRIKAAAEANNRSMNAEIVATLEEKYPAPKMDWASFDRFLDLFESALNAYQDTDDPIKRDRIARQINELSKELKVKKSHYFPPTNPPATE
ncbi:Arc family DNA-binding protein [Ketogulonicigenium robustum]|uniref:Arc family DNA-binding protein n=1 Tax=Ketogulonicigenium robustum TaxID=92947 RepID=UPI000A26B904|nr:Arc family DNA-binding protein [Ketogulonicigenium robustum]